MFIPQQVSEAAQKSKAEGVHLQYLEQSPNNCSLTPSFTTASALIFEGEEFDTYNLYQGFGADVLLALTANE